MSDGTSTDVILCIDFRGTGVAAVLAGRLLGKPVILQAETPDALSGAHQDAALQRKGLSPGGWSGRQVKAVLRAFYGRADALVCISREIETEVRSCGIEENRIHYIPHGVDVQRFQPAAIGSSPVLRAQLPGHVIAVFVGRLSREKGILDLLDAWSQIDVADATLVIVGPDMPGHPLDVGTEVRRRVEDPRWRGRVVLYGPADPAPLLAGADVMVQPSHYEAFGQSALEAVACGLPVVASRTGGLPDFLHHGENALLFEPQDVQGLADALRTLLRSEEMRKRFGRRGREIAEQQFSLPVVVRQYADLCRRLTGARA